MVVLSVRKEATAEASFAAIFERSRFGIAIAAMINMIATTINNSMSEKPFSFLVRMHGAPCKFWLQMPPSLSRLTFRYGFMHVFFQIAKLYLLSVHNGTTA